MPRRIGAKDKKKRRTRNAMIIGGSSVGLAGGLGGYGIAHKVVGKKQDIARGYAQTSKRLIKRADEVAKPKSLTVDEFISSALINDAEDTIKPKDYSGMFPSMKVDRNAEVANLKKYTKQIQKYRTVKAAAIATGLGAGIGLGAYLGNRYASRKR